MPRIQRATAFCLVLALTAQLACGTILYPERRGQKSGRIDPAVAIMDGIGLLLFLIPGSRRSRSISRRARSTCPAAAGVRSM